jgi:hypothetical protein
MLVSRYLPADLISFEEIVSRLLDDDKIVVIVRSVFEFDSGHIRNIADELLQLKYLELYKTGDLSAAQLAEEIDQAYYSNYMTRGRLPENCESDDVIDAIAKKYADVLVLDRMDYICDREAKRCYSINEQFEKYFYDYGHNTLAGARFFGARVDQIDWLKPLSNIEK